MIDVDIVDNKLEGNSPFTGARAVNGATATVKRCNFMGNTAVSVSPFSLCAIGIVCFVLFHTYYFKT